MTEQQQAQLNVMYKRTMRRIMDVGGNHDEYLKACGFIHAMKMVFDTFKMDLPTITINDSQLPKGSNKPV